MYLVLIFLLLFVAIYIFVNRFFTIKTISKKKSNNNSYISIYLAIWAVLPSFIIFLIINSFSHTLIDKLYLHDLFKGQKPIVQSLAKSEVTRIASEIAEGVEISTITTHLKAIDKNILITVAKKYIYYQNIGNISISVFILCLISLTLLIMINKINLELNFQKKIEKFIKNIFLVFAVIAVMTTFGILCSLFFEAFLFFKEVSILKFLFGTKWAPNAYEMDPDNSFGVVPLLSGTFLIAFISIAVAGTVGVSAAIYMSEYMSNKTRKIIKPMIEILAGIPSIVYGFFAAISFAPFLVFVFDQFFNLSISAENALNAGVVMGIMIIPLVSSLSDDILNSIPNSMREGAMGMGSMKNEMIRHILIPAALPGIAGSILLAISRAIGETMIVVMASSLAANLTFNPLEPVTTVTTQIAILVQGDQEFNSPKTLSAFALGLMLLLLTLILNIIAIRIVNRYKKTYE